MQQFTIIAALAATASAYSVSIQNNCNKPAYIWSCGTTLGEMQTLQPGSEPWSEAFYSKDGSSGPSIYVSDGKSNTDGNIAQLEYFYQQDIQKVWWDISLINGKPFPEIALGSDLENPPYDACKPVQCSGVGKCAGVYHTHEQLMGTHDCPPSNLVMKLCDSEGNWNSGKASSGGKPADTQESKPAAIPAPSKSAPKVEAPSYTVAPAPTTEAPAPTTTAAPVKGHAFAQLNDNGEVVVHTAYATTIVTKVVTANAPAPSGKITEAADGEVHAKRDSHAHAHAHGARAHSRSLKRHNHQS